MKLENNQSLVLCINKYVDKLKKVMKSTFMLEN